MRPARIALASVFALLALSSIAQARGPGDRDHGPTLDLELVADGGGRGEVACDEAPLRGPRVGPSARGEREGRAVLIRWGGSWWDGTVLKQRNGEYYVHYTGYDASWDEWVGPERIRFARAWPIERPPARQVRAARILWGGSWWDGTVLKQRGDRYYIHYTGYDASWDEWVGPERIRLL